MSTTQIDNGKIFVENLKTLNDWCTQSNHNKNQKFQWSNASNSSSNKEIWNLKCITRWRVQCKYYLGEFKEKNQVKETSTSSICSKNGWPKEGLVVGLD